MSVSDDRRLTRRSLIKKGAAAGAALGVSSLLGRTGSAAWAASDQSAAPETIVYGTYGGSWLNAVSKAWLDPFNKAHPNIKVISDITTDESKIRPMVEGGHVKWDVVEVSNIYGFKPEADILNPIQCGPVPCGDFPANAIGKYRVGQITYSMILAWRTDKLSAGPAPRSWADFFDVKKFPGKRGVYNQAINGMLEIPLLADGVSPKHLYPLDVDRALKKLDTIKDQIVWWEGGSQAEQQLADGEVTMQMNYSNRVADLFAQKVPVGMSWNQHLLSVSGLVVPKKTAHVSAAMTFVGWVVSAQHDAALARYGQPVGPANPKAVKYGPKSPSVRRFLPATYSAQTVPINAAWWSANRERVAEKFQKWLQG
jgi:putative spermidine/putrescine transport system substrate-binding protein